MKTRLFKALFFPFRARPGAALPARVERVLVIRQDNRIGNLVLITPLLTLIKQRWPKCRLDVVVGGSFGAVIRNHPAIDRLKIYDQLRFIRMPWKFFGFLVSLRRARYDVVFDLKSVFSFNNMMLSVVSGARYRVGFKNPLSRGFFHCEVDLPDPQKYEAEYVAELLRPFMDITRVPAIRCLPLAAETEKARAQLAAAGLDKRAPVGIHTGGRGIKKISPERFLALGFRLREEGVPAVFFFGPDEKKEVPLFRAHGFPCFSPATPDAFNGFLPFLRFFVSCDTGPMHMAAGAGTPTLSFFMQSSPERFAPRGPKNRHHVVAPDADIVPFVLQYLKETVC
ncbi:MAG: glycosyltransferase family 9 protein [Fibrobacterota bacterium]